MFRFSRTLISQEDAENWMLSARKALFTKPALIRTRQAKKGQKNELRLAPFL